MLHYFLNLNREVTVLDLALAPCPQLGLGGNVMFADKFGLAAIPLRATSAPRSLRRLPCVRSQL